MQLLFGTKRWVLLTLAVAGIFGGDTSPWIHWWAASLLLIAAGLVYQRVRAENRALRRALAEKDCLLAELRQARDGKAQFVANISHELCTPMNGILGALDLLQETRLASGQRELLTLATGSGRGLYALIRRLVDYAQADDTQAPIEDRPFSLQEIVERLAQTVCADAESRGLAFSLRIDPAAPDWLAGDPRQVRGILDCLLQNAVKFTTAGRVSLQVLPGAPASGDAVRIVIADTGPGIAPAQQERIFTAFAQVDDSMTRAYGGLGIGLAVALRAARHIGGRLELESTLGVGSRFTFFLPAAIRCPVPAGQTPYRRERRGELHRRALVIHSDPEVRQALEETVSATGMRVVTLNEIPAGGVVDVTASHIFIEESQLETASPPWPPRARIILLYSRLARHRIGIPGRETTELASPFLPAEVRHLLRGGNFATRSSAPVQGHANGAGLGMRVLLVDDSATNRKIAELLLQRLGCSVQTAENGQLALDLLARQRSLLLPFDLVLMDCQMPVLDGYEATRRLRAGGDQTPVVALTAQIGPGESIHCSQAGMDDYLTKPLSRQALLRVLQTYVAAAPATPGASELDRCIVLGHDMPLSGQPIGAVDA